MRRSMLEAAASKDIRWRVHHPISSEMELYVVGYRSKMLFKEMMGWTEKEWDVHAEETK